MSKKPTTSPKAAQVEEAQLVDAAANEQTETPVEQSQQPQLGFVTAAIFNFVRADGSTGQDRVFIQGVPNLRYRAQIEHFERAIVEQSQGQLIKALIVAWYPLEG